MRRWTVSTWVVVCLLVMAWACFMAGPVANAQEDEPAQGETEAATGAAPRGDGGRPTGRPGSGRGAWDPVAMRYPDITWAAVQFECNADAEEMAKLQAAYKEVHSQLETARTQARESRDFTAMAEAYAEAKSRLESELAKTLNDEQKADLKSWEKTCASMLGDGASGRRGGPRGGDLLYLERALSAMTFRLGVDSEQLAELEPAFRAAWDQRKAAAKEGQEALATAAGDIRSSLEEKIKQTLTAEQWTQFEEGMTRRRRPAGGRGTGRAGGRGAAE